MKKIVLFIVLFLLSTSVFSTNEIWFVQEAGQTNLKATLTRPSDGYVWNTSSSVFAASSGVAWTDRDIAVSEDTDNPGVYYGNLPAIGTTGTAILVRIYSDAATLEITDQVIENFILDWGGTQEIWNNDLADAIAEVDTAVGSIAVPNYIHALVASATSSRVFIITGGDVALTGEQLKNAVLIVSDDTNSMKSISVVKSYNAATNEITLVTPLAFTPELNDDVYIIGMSLSSGVF